MALPESLEYLPFKSLSQLGIASLGTLALGAVSALGGRELSATYHDRALCDGKPKVIPRSSDTGDYAVIVRLGFRQDPLHIAAALDSHLAPFGSRYYMKSSPNVTANKEARLQIAGQERGRKLIVIGISKGGKDEVSEYTDLEYMEQHGPISFLSIESSPLHRRHIRGRGRAALVGAHLFLPQIHTAAKFYTRLTEPKAADTTDYSDFATPEEIDIFEKLRIQTCFYEAKHEIPMLLRSLPGRDVMAAGMSTENIKNIAYFSSPYDEAIDTFSAYAWLAAASGRDDMQFIVDTDRPHGNHAGVTEFPDRHIEELHRFAAGDHDTIPSLASA